MSKFGHLFQPATLRGRALKNRIVFGAHTANMARDGYPVERHRAYYEERAIGGAAMIVVEPMPVHATGVLTRGNFRHDDDSVIPCFRELTDAVRGHGALVLQQLYHVGAHGDSDLSFQPHWSPSGQPSYHDSDGSHAMTSAEIEELVDGHVKAAIRCREAGFDGVEIWGQYHSLLEQFWSPWSNRRSDEWGGSLENRMRLGSRIFEGVRQACGDDFIIGFSVSYSENTPFILGLDELLEIVAAYDAKRYMDYVSCTTGGYIEFEALMPTFMYAENLGVPLAKAVKGVVNHALVTAENHVRTPQNADYAIASGSADLVSIVRGQIADPHLARKAAEDREQDIRGCISCNQMCWGRRSRDYWISCLVNPSVGREHEWGGDRFSPAATARTVLIVGAGPAGLESARVAAERGHRVTLCEASGDLGGQFHLAGLAPRRGQILELMEWYRVQLEQLGVEVRYHAPMDADDVMAFSPEVTVLATGSLPDCTGYQRWLPQQPELPGMNTGNVWFAEEVLRREARPGQQVILLDEGGNWRGLGTALYLQQQGHDLVIVTPDPYVGRELTRTTADIPLRKQLAKAGARFMVESAILRWGREGATVVSLLDGAREQVQAESLVLATTNRASDELALSLRDSGLEIHAIGDCVAPRQAPYAFYEGRKLGLSI